jgi:hypothetical protein
MPFFPRYPSRLRHRADPWAESSSLGRSGPFVPDHAMVLRIFGIADETTKQSILDKVKTLTDVPTQFLSMSWSTASVQAAAMMWSGQDAAGDLGVRSARFSADTAVLTVALGPVGDPQAFIAKIDFGKVIRVAERVVDVVVEKPGAAGPGQLGPGSLPPLLPNQG